MANVEQLSILKQGVKIWNKWRDNNPTIEIDLTGADLSNIKLGDVNFYRAKLNNANFSYSSLSFAYFSKANLYRANFKEADLSFASFSKANLTRANLSCAKLYRGDFRETILSNTNFNNARLYGAEFDRAYFYKAFLIEAYLNNANLTNVYLDKTDLTRANLSESNLKGTYLRNSILRYVDFTDANLSCLIVLDSDFLGVNLTGACIQDWKLEGKVNLDCISCDYVYLKSDLEKPIRVYSQRLPYKNNFKDEEFKAIFEEINNGVELILPSPMDLLALACAFETVNSKIRDNIGGQLYLLEYKANVYGSIVIKLALPESVDSSQIKEDLIELYHKNISNTDKMIPREKRSVMYENLFSLGSNIK